MKKYKFSENEHGYQSAFFNWVRRNRKDSPNEGIRDALNLCYAVPNGLSTNQSQKAKMEGLTKGMPDVNLDWASEREEENYWGNYETVDDCYGLRIEFKYGRNTLTTDQKEKKVLLEKAGYKWVTCWTVKEAIEAVMNYLPFPVEDYVKPEYL